MGVEARFQAMPEDCELLQRARQDREIAEEMQFFNTDAQEIYSESSPSTSPAETYFLNAVKKLIEAKPGLIDRYYHASGRTFEAIVYLLSPDDRAGNIKNDTSLIHEIIYGSELLHPGVGATQGYPIGFMNAQKVQVAADYLDSITYEQLHEFYNPPKMAEMGVYKMHVTSDETKFQSIWEEFVGMRDVYRAAADHGEAMITVID